MKTIVFSFSLIVAALALVATVTQAYFSASGSITENTVSTGTLTLAVNAGAGKPVTLSNIAPGYVDSSYRYFDAFNNGSLPAEFFFAFDYATGSADLYNALSVELRDGGYTGACDGPVIYNGLISAFSNNSKISQYNVHANSSAIDGELDNINAGWTMRVCQKISFIDSGGDQNALQGQSVTFSETVNSRQDKNPDLLP